MSRRHPCDVCGHERKRWQRLCDVCFRALPPSHRTAIIDAHRQRKSKAKREAIRCALQFMGDAVSRHMRAITSGEAYNRTAAQLGEREQ